MNNEDFLLMENMQKIKNKVIVMSGKGGVGKSTVSVNLAYYFAIQGYKVGLLDVDIHGPSVAKMTGIEGKTIPVDKDGKAHPIEALSNFYVVSIASMLENPDDPIIWRGPAKIGAIKQFLTDIQWPELDYLVIDCPPGTGDEPLSVIQLINDISGTVIVSTPQDVAMLDVRKSINFARKLDLPIIGLVENMSGFICPHCNKIINIFKTGGVEKASKDFGIELLGKIPLQEEIATSGDEGKAFVYHYAKTKAGEVFNGIGEKVLNKISNYKSFDKNNQIIAMPVDNSENLSEHFGSCEKFLFATIKNGKIESTKIENTPEKGHSLIPVWLQNQNVKTVILNGVGEHAYQNLKSQKMKVHKGVEVENYKTVLEKYLNGTLVEQELEDCHSKENGHSSCGSSGSGGCGCSGGCH